MNDALQWYRDMGVDELYGEESCNHLQPVPEVKPVAVKQAPQAVASAERGGDVLQAVEACADVAALRQLVTGFKGLGITKTATHTVFSDGNPEADIMLIGEAPGAEEDAQGIPFCGASGKLLDKILSYIDLDRKRNIYISNTVFWRPPGNRKPTPEELAVCAPMVQKHIALIRPKLIMLLGATAVSSVLERKEGITRIRGQFFDYKNPYMDAVIPAVPVFHPSYLLRSPGQKRFIWQDMLKIADYIQQQDINV